jgi:ABC-type glycerol-3-phosphate transport system substrate-binding protein
MVIEDKRVMDLSEYMESDAEWKEMIEPSVLECFEEEDGSMYLAPISTAIFSCSGMFWNEELFAKAGIYEFPKTWDEFWVCCDRLEACGIAPLALHTEGTAWAPMLITSAALADTEEGAAFMKELFPDSYQNENGMTMADTLTKLFSYTTADALHNDFDVSFDNFFSGKAAMIPNGYWMIEQIPEEWKDKVRFSAFPGNKMVSSPETFGWAVVDSYSEEVKEGAVEFLKFRTEYNLREKEKLLNYGGARKMRVLTDYVNAYLGEPQIVPNYQTKWNSIFQEKTLGEYLPELVTRKITAEEFLEAADASIAAYKLEH